MQIAELHYRTTEPFPFTKIAERAKEILKSSIATSDSKSADKTFIIFHTDHTIEYNEGSMPAQTAFFHSEQAPEPDSYEEVIQQSWQCPNARELLAESTSIWMITEMMARQLAPELRLTLFHGVLQAAVEVTSPVAIVFKHSQQVIDPAEYLASTETDLIQRPGALNVRFFTISNSEGDMIMDTRGLEEIGLHDLQCHFRGLNPNEISRVLYNTGVYIFENGAVIESGQTVMGIEPDSRWKCQFEDSLLEPTRELLDINPGSPFAAGGRE